jgi:hypothetical protein
MGKRKLLLRLLFVAMVNIAIIAIYLGLIFLMKRFFITKKARVLYSKFSKFP